MILLTIAPAALSPMVAADGSYFMAASVAVILAETVVLARRATIQAKRNADFNNMKRKT